MTSLDTRSVLILFAVAVAAVACSTVPVSVRGNASEGWGIAGYVGNSSTQAATGVEVKLRDVDTGAVLATATTDAVGKYEFLRLKPGSYVLESGKVQRKVLLPQRDLRVDLDLSKPNGEMNYAAGAAKAAQSGGGAADPGPSDAALMQSFAGRYYGYSAAGQMTGGTERRLTLCADGRFRYGSETAYSGFEGEWQQGGNSANQGRWSIQGSKGQGRIVLSYENGARDNVDFRAVDNKGCYSFNSSTLCFEGPSGC